MLDDAPLPTRYDVDECVAIPVDPRTLYVYWEVRGARWSTCGGPPGGAIALRVVVIVPTWDGRARASVTTTWTRRGRQLRPRPAGRLRRARRDRLPTRDAFVAIAHSPALDTPPGAPSPLVADTLVRNGPAPGRSVSHEDGDAATIVERAPKSRRQAAATSRAHGAELSADAFVRIERAVDRTSRLPILGRLRRKPAPRP